jgi:hypothetical protein
MLGKKAQLGNGRKIIGSVLGIIFLAIGVIPLLNQFKVVSFVLPAIPMIVLWVLGVVGGVVLLIDGLKEGADFGLAKGLMIPTLIVSIALLAISVVPLLNMFGVISFALPYIGQIVMDILFAAAGVLLIIDAFAMSM